MKEVVLHYVRFTHPLSFQSKFPKRGPTYRRQMVNPRHKIPQGQSVAEHGTPSGLGPMRSGLRTSPYGSNVQHGQSHMGKFGKWPWCCITTSKTISTELRTEKIRSAFDPWASPYRSNEQRTMILPNYESKLHVARLQLAFHWNSEIIRAAVSESDLAQGQADIGQMCKWPWHCPITGLAITTELRMDKIRPHVSETMHNTKSGSFNMSELLIFRRKRWCFLVTFQLPKAAYTANINVRWQGSFSTHCPQKKYYIAFAYHSWR